MADLRKVKPGDPLVIPASTFNTFVDTAQDFLRRQRSIGRTPATDRPAFETVLLKNASGADRGRFDVLGVDGPVFTPTDSLETFTNGIALAGVTPTADHAGRFVILQEPVPNGEVGLAVAAGVCPVIALSIWGDVRTIGFAVLATEDDPPRGLVDVRVRPSSKIWITCDYDCEVEVARVTTNPILYVENPPTWNAAQPGVLPWNSPGGDFAAIGTMTMTAGVAQSVTGQAVADALQVMVDGGPDVTSFLVRKLDESDDRVSVTGSVDVDFDLAG